MEEQYQMPTLVFVGRINEVVQGVPGGGFDFDFGMSATDFEYEQD